MLSYSSCRNRENRMRPMAAVLPGALHLEVQLDFDNLLSVHLSDMKITGREKQRLRAIFFFVVALL